MRLFLAVAVVITSFSAPVSAAGGAADPAEDKVVCKRVHDAETGSNFRRSKRTCMKKSEWKELDEELNRTMRGLADGRANPNAPQGMGGGPN